MFSRSKEALTPPPPPPPKKKTLPTLGGGVTDDNGTLARHRSYWLTEPIPGMRVCVCMRACGRDTQAKSCFACMCVIISVLLNVNNLR